MRFLLVPGVLLLAPLAYGQVPVVGPELPSLTGEILRQFFDEGRLHPAIAAPLAQVQRELPKSGPGGPPWGKEGLASWGSQGFPKGFSKELLHSMLQRVIDAAYGKGFRYLGDEYDFNHGHILFPKDSFGKNPVGILYHTQEYAYFYHRSLPGHAYDYLDPGARNWIQWTDASRPVENAYPYARKSYPDTPEWSSVRDMLPAFQAHYTVVTGMLDPELVGTDLGKNDYQWFFPRIDCPPDGRTFPSGSNGVEVRLPTGEKACLALESTECHQGVWDCS